MVIKQKDANALVADEEDATSGESIQNTLLNQADALVQNKKRVRTEKKPETRSVRKKYIKGKQGGLRDLMNMPLDIFTEIAYLLNPGDLVSLSRSNKYFRNLLLQRSAVQIWRRAESNMPGLPPCPPGISEPQYAALMFSKTCTLCGASTAVRPDPNLRARLCASCRDTELIQLNKQYHRATDLVSYTTDVRPKKKNSQTRASKHTVFSLRHEVVELYRKQKEFYDAGDKEGLAQWEDDQQRLASARIQHALDIALYLIDVDYSREGELDSMRQQRKERIEERLKALGWTEGDMNFRGDVGKPWRALVEAPKPLTDRIWSNLRPKLTLMLEENRERNLEYDRKTRRLERRTRVDQFLIQMRYTSHPFEPILAALGIEVPPPPNVVGLTSIQTATTILQSRIEVSNPFPRTHTLLKWGGLNDLSELEMPIEDVVAKLEERTPRILEKVAEWRTTIQRGLVKRLDLGSSQEEAILKVKDSTESTAYLSRDARILLRADSVFKRNDIQDPLRPPLRELPPCYYPEFVSPYDNTLNERVSDPYRDIDQEINLDLYTRDLETEVIVKTLLQQLGMQDVTWVELKVMKNIFLCGRCPSKIPRTWRLLIIHYIAALGTWDKAKDSKGEQPTCHPVVFNNVHDLKSTYHKPLVQLLSEEEALQTAALINASFINGSASSRPLCFLCKATGRPEVRLSQENMAVHMQDVHDVGEIVEGVHYGPKSLWDLSGDGWNKVWDEYQDSREAAIVGDL
ncbi:hypothetical protein FRC12_010794 [Ceratobasidium sp. 428]|nr:hypothetical protein FRC12_010794 [Ceratobasidium sp. 428]